jgi:hypothetical protein
VERKQPAETAVVEEKTAVATVEDCKDSQFMSICGESIFADGYLEADDFLDFVATRSKYDVEEPT